MCDHTLFLLPASSKRSGGAGGEEGDQETFVQKGETEVEMDTVFDQWTRLDGQFMNPSWKYEHGCRGDRTATLQIAAF